MLAWFGIEFPDRVVKVRLVSQVAPIVFTSNMMELRSYERELQGSDILFSRLVHVDCEAFQELPAMLDEGKCVSKVSVLTAVRICSSGTTLAGWWGAAGRR